jgi:aerobic-type carbon monoxide dehydrogenase small subunit (CoxS/CutS family)
MVSLKINGEVKNADAPPDMPLLWVLRRSMRRLHRAYRGRARTILSIAGRVGRTARNHDH